MARVSVSLFSLFVTVVALGVPAQEAVAAPTPPQDLVVGGGEAGIFHDISIDARSDPLGGNASGNVSFRLVLPFGEFPISGPVTCLGLDGTHAVIGFSDTSTGFGTIRVEVFDGGSVVGSRDVFAANPQATDCSTDLPPDPLAVVLSSGDIVVRDAASTAQCRIGGWRNYTDATGQPFRNQGECIAFALGAA